MPTGPPLSRRQSVPPRRSALPPPLAHWWAGFPRSLLEETGAYLLPAQLPLRREDRLLALGAGTVALASALSVRVPLHAPPIGLTANGGATRQPELPGVDLVRAWPEALPFPDASFTVVLVGHQIRTWEDDLLLRFLREAWRLLTHNGIAVLWEVAPSRSPRVNAIWRRLMQDDGRAPRLRSFAEIGRLGRDAGFAWIQTLRLRPFLWPPGPRLTVAMRKEHYDRETVRLPRGATPPLR